jgi:hypothetical protein
LLRWGALCLRLKSGFGPKKEKSEITFLSSLKSVLSGIIWYILVLLIIISVFKFITTVDKSYHFAKRSFGVFNLLRNVFLDLKHEI